MSRHAADARAVCAALVDLECSGDDRWARVDRRVGRVADQQAHDPSTNRTFATAAVPWLKTPLKSGAAGIVNRVAGLFSARYSLKSDFSSLAAAAGEASAITVDTPPASLGPVVCWLSAPRKPSLRRRLASAAALGFPAVHEAAGRHGPWSRFFHSDAVSRPEIRARCSHSADGDVTCCRKRVNSTAAFKTTASPVESKTGRSWPVKTPVTNDARLQSSVIHP